MIADLLSEEAYKAFIKRNAKDAPPIRQNWNIYIDLRIKKIKTRYLVSVALVNCSQVQSNPTTHKSNKRADDKITIETLFNSGLDIQLQDADFAPIKMDYFADDYKYDGTQEFAPLYRQAEEIWNTYGVVVLIADKLTENRGDAELCLEYEWIEPNLDIIENCLAVYPTDFFRYFDRTMCIQLAGFNGNYAAFYTIGELMKQTQNFTEGKIFSAPPL